MGRNVLVAGVGMVPFGKPGKSDDYVTMGSTALRAALIDAGVTMERVDQTFAGYVYGDSTAGQRVVYEVGMTGGPVLNVNNNCASGSSALYLARQAVASGAAWHRGGESHVPPVGRRSGGGAGCLARQGCSNSMRPKEASHRPDGACLVCGRIL